MASALLTALRENLRRAIKNKNLPEADAVLHHLKNEDPLDVHTRGFELEVALLAGRDLEIESLAKALPDLFPASPKIHLLAGRGYYRMKNYAKALAHFEESERIHSFPLTRLWQAKALSQLGRLGEAESLLQSLSKDLSVETELAWVYERQGREGEAIKMLEAYLRRHPQDAAARERQLRLKARRMETGALEGEMDQRREHLGPLPEGLWLEFVKKLFDEGQILKARAEVKERESALSPAKATELAWICRQSGADDLAFALFLGHLAAHVRDFKYMAALESSALKCRRAEELKTAYEALAPQHPALYGRLKSLIKRGGVEKNKDDSEGLRSVNRSETPHSPQPSPASGRGSNKSL